MFFNPAEEPDDTFQVIPPGTYRVGVVDAELKPTKAGTGRMAVVLLELLQGEHKGQRVTARFNIENPSETAQRIGRAQFKGFLAACGVTQALKTDQDFYRAVSRKTCFAEIDHEKAQDGKVYARPVRFAAAQQPNGVTTTTSTPFPPSRPQPSVPLNDQDVPF